jgi:ATP-binding cassette subfamily B protein
MSNNPQESSILPKPNLPVLKWLAGYIRPYRWLFLRLIATMLVFAFLDATLPLLTRTAIDRFAVPRRTDGLVWFALVCALFAVVRGLAVWCMILTGGKTYTGVSRDLARDCFEHLQGLSFAYFDRHGVGWLMSRLTSDTQLLGRVFAWIAVDLVDATGRVVIMSIIMFTLNWKLALLVLAVVPPMVLIIGRFQLLTLAKFREVRHANAAISGAFNEGIMGARTTKTLVREEASLAEFAQRSETMRTASVSAARTSGLYLPLVLILGSVGSALALWIGGNGVLAGDISYGVLVAFIAYAIAFFEPMKDLANRFPQLQNAQAAAERVHSLLQTQAEIVDTPEALMRQQSQSLPPFQGQVEFDQVCFSYTAKETVLDNFSLKVPMGRTVALVGETGAGKTTIANLICRFYEPTSGTIRIDGMDYRHLPLVWLRSHLGIVQQTPHLFSGTIRENIRYGDLKASDEQVETAARLVNAHSFIATLPEGYEFRVGECGEGLSTGQKQLVSLARVMLANPKLLILDEATSSVDAETERLIQDAIDKVLQNRTSFIIAHRLATIRRADQILLIRNGRVLEQGSHRELIRLRGAYYSLYRSQFVATHEAQLLG